MRRIEDAGGYDIPSWRATPPGPPRCPAICRFGRCGHYSRLVLTASRRGAAAASEEKDDDVFELTRSAIWEHLTRRGSNIDHFEHPVIFAAAGLDTVDAMGNGRSLLKEHLAGPYERDFTAATYGACLREEVVLDESEEQSVSSAEDDSDNDDKKSSRSPDLPSMAKNYNLPGLVGEFHILLNKTPSLANLSLNGYFHIFFGMPSPVLSTLQYLSLGPLLPFWPAVFNLGREEGPPVFEKLENLKCVGS